MPTPALIDTDIGTDVDDLYALLLALRSPELDVRGVSLVHGDLQARAAVASRLMRLLQDGTTPISLGESEPLNRDRPVFWMGHEGEALPSSCESHACRPRKTLAELVERSPEPVTVITLGPMTNVAKLIADRPDLLTRIARIVAMAGSFEGYGNADGSMEHNVRLDPEATDRVLTSGLPALLIGLNVTRHTRLGQRELARIRVIGGELARFFVLQTNRWLRVIERDIAPMHDALAVAAAFRPDIVSFEPVSVSVSLDPPGRLFFERDANSTVQVAVHVDYDAFHDLLTERLFKACVCVGGRRVH